MLLPLIIPFLRSSKIRKLHWQRSHLLFFYFDKLCVYTIYQFHSYLDNKKQGQLALITALACLSTNILLKLYNKQGYTVIQ